VNFRHFTIALLIATFPGARPVYADISGHPSAICGGVLLSLDELAENIEKGFASTRYSPLSFAEPNLKAFGALLDRFPEKEAKEARKKLAVYLSRKDMPGIRTTAFVFSGDGAAQFLKSSAINAAEIGAQAKKNTILKPLVISAFGLRSVISLAAIPTLLSMNEDKAWYTIPAALMAIQFGRPVVKALLRSKESALQKFMVSEFEQVGKTSADTGLNMLSITGHSNSDFKATMTFQENLRAPYAQDIIFDARMYGHTGVKRIIEKKNPFISQKKTAHIDLFAFPQGQYGERQILVLTAEGI
jgi:hypothetical protein